MFWNIWLVVAILCSFVWASKRAVERDPTLVNFLRFIVEFIAFPVIVVFEEFTNE